MNLQKEIASKQNLIIKADCFDAMRLIPDKSVDMILADLPYGVTARNKWDSVLPFDKLWSEYNRILKESGVVVLTAIQPFTSLVVCSNLEQFKYEWVWEKQQGTGFLNAKKQPLRNHESVLVFYKKQPTYNPQMTEGKPYTCKSGTASNNYGEQVSVVTKNSGQRYPLTVQKFSYDKNKLHPTQKPVALFEYLVKTYTNEGDLVLDNTAGVLTTAVACENTNRQYIVIEKEQEYIDKGKTRLSGNYKYFEV